MLLKQLQRFKSQPGGSGHVLPVVVDVIWRDQPVNLRMTLHLGLGDLEQLACACQVRGLVGHRKHERPQVQDISALDELLF